MRKVWPFLVILTLTYFLSEADVMQKFMPRSVCMFGKPKLITLHLISDAVIFIAYVGIGAILLKVYFSLKEKGFPFAKFFWKFGGFIFFCGLTHLVGVINLFVTYYWIDGIVKLITAWFSILVFISLMQSYPDMRNMKTPAEFIELKRRLDAVLETLKER